MANWYINADIGNDTTGNGSSALPYLTFSKAYTAASSGDSIIFQQASAIYTMPVLTIAKNITAYAVTFGDAIFGNAVNPALTISSTYALTIYNLKFRDITYSGNDQPFTVNGTLNISRCDFDSSVVVATSSNVGTGGCFLLRSGSVTEVEQCLFNNVVRNETLNAAVDIGLFSHRLLTPTSLTVKNSTFYFNAAQGAGALNYICNFVAESNSPITNFTNCIFQDAAAGLTHFWNTSYTASYTNNITYSCINGITFTADTATANITSDPLFVDPANGNFNLRPTSPCISSGTLV